MNMPVYALATLPNGDLVAGGNFTTAGGVSANYIARWNGTSWSALGPGTNGDVLALTTLPNGDIVAGGRFTTAGGVSANRVARWNGTSWSALGSGMSGGISPFINSSVSALAVLPNGDVVAAGYFTTAGGVSANHIARWNGTSWSALGSGMFLPTSYPSEWPSVNALAVMSNGDLVAGGQFATAGGVIVNNIARWDGTSWSALVWGMNGPVVGLTTLPNGDLVAGGQFTFAGAVSVNRIARWNGASWSALGSGGPTAPLTTLPNGDLVARHANGLVRWNGTSWSALGSAISYAVYALATLPNGDLVAGGNFTVAGGAAAAYVAQLTTTCPATVVSYGTGCTGSGGPNVLAAASLPWIGSTFRANAIGMPASALALGVFGFSTTSIPMLSILPHGVPGCTLLVSPDLLQLYVPAAGTVQTQLVIPNTVALAVAVLHEQVVPIELGGTGSITELTGTNALTLTIGSY